MKPTRWPLCLALGFCFAANAAEFFWQNFDASPTGSVANLPGWTRAAWRSAASPPASTTSTTPAPPPTSSNCPGTPPPPPTSSASSAKTSPASVDVRRCNSPPPRSGTPATRPPSDSPPISCAEPPCSRSRSPSTPLSRANGCGHNQDARPRSVLGLASPNGLKNPEASATILRK